MKKVTTAEYHRAWDDSQGYCTTCEEFTRDTTEPDAEDYDCPSCEEDTVLGVMAALEEGAIEIEDGPEDEDEAEDFDPTLDAA